MIFGAAGVEDLEVEVIGFWSIPSGGDDGGLVAGFLRRFGESQGVSLESAIGEVVLEQDGELHGVKNVPLRRMTAKAKRGLGLIFRGLFRVTLCAE